MRAGHCAEVNTNATSDCANTSWSRVVAHRNTNALLKPRAVSGPHCAWLPDTWQSHTWARTSQPRLAQFPLPRSSLCTEMGLGKPAEHLQPHCSKLPSVWLLALNQEWKLAH